ncbi:MAG: HAD family hydrolase [Candidatus Hodarchaeota archaeon]
MTVKAIVWDLDGTLIHFKIDFLRARKIAIKILKKYGVPTHLLTVKGSILENIEYSREFFKKEGISEERIKEIIDEVDNEIIKIEYEAAINASIINGIDEVLEFAKVKNLKQAIFTFNTKKNAEISLKKVNLLHYFNVIIGRDNVTNLKPHPDHLYYICKALNVKPNEILVIGDTNRDIEAAINVGAHSIALNTKTTTLFKQDTFKKAREIIELEEIPSKLINAIEKLLEN